MGTGQSAASHEGTDLLEPHAKDDEVLTMTRGDLRRFADHLLNVAMKRIDARIDEKLKDHVRMETVQL